MTYYESAPDDAFFIIDAKEKAVIAPQVVNVAKNERFIWGVVDPKGDKAFDVTPKGLFVIDGVTGDLKVGMDAETMRKAYPSLLLEQMVAPPSFWAKKSGVYHPHLTK